jgi:hypothetical protein
MCAHGVVMDWRLPDKERVNTSVQATRSLKGWRPSVRESIRRYLPPWMRDFSHFPSKDEAMQCGHSAVDAALMVRRALLDAEVARRKAEQLPAASVAQANDMIVDGLMLLANLAYDSEYRTEAVANDSGAGASDDPPTNVTDEVQRLQVVEWKGLAELSLPIDDLLTNGRLNPHVVERPSPPADACTGQRSTWSFLDSRAIDGVFSSQLLEELREQLEQLQFDNPMVTTCAARGERVHLSELLSAGQKHTPQRCTMSVGGGPSGSAGDAALRARYNFQLQGVRESDIVCAPMPHVFAEAGAAVLAAFEHLVPVGSKALTGLQVNRCVHGCTNDWHHDNATPGPGGWALNSQERGTYVFVVTVWSRPDASPAFEVRFRDGEQREVAWLRPRDNSAYAMGPRTDERCEHAMFTIGPPHNLVRYALCFRVLDLWHAFAVSAPWAIVLPEERCAAAAAAQHEYVESQRVRHLARALARLEKRTRQAGEVDEAVRRQELITFRRYHSLSAADFGDLLREVSSRYVVRETRSRSAGRGKRVRSAS